MRITNYADALSRLAKLVCRRVPAGDALQHVGGLGVEILEDAAKELAEDERVHERRFVLGVDGVVDRVDRYSPTIHFVREIHLVSAAAVVVRTAGANGEAQRHRLQRSRLVAGNLEALDLRGKRDALVSDCLSRATTALGQQVPETLAPTHERDRTQHRISASESQPRLVKPSTFDTLHGEGDRAADTDRVDAQLVAQLGRAENDVGIAHPTQRA
jgi:hypothetical protein